MNSLQIYIYLQTVIQMVGTVLAFTRWCKGSNRLLWESRWHSCSDKNILWFKRRCQSKLCVAIFSHFALVFEMTYYMASGM